jgi:holin-like protein
MNIMMELALIFGICLVGTGIAALLPFSVPYSVIGLLILTVLLFKKIILPCQIREVSGFLIGNMGIFFVPAVVGTMEYVETLKIYMFPFFVIVLLSTPLVYLLTGWVVQLCLRYQKGTAHE